MKCLYLVTRSLDPTGKGQGTMGDEVVESAWGAGSALLPVCFPRPLAEPGVKRLDRVGGAQNLADLHVAVEERDGLLPRAVHSFVMAG